MSKKLKNPVRERSKKMKSKRIKAFVITAVVVLVLVMAVVFVVPLARERSECVSMEKEWMGLLKEHPTFSAKRPVYPFDVNFYYATPDDTSLTRLREKYDLETVAGRGSEIDRIINLMTWVYQLAEHANEPKIPKERNAFTFIHMAKDEQMSINCYMKTTILNEVYLSMGFYSRHTHLLPYSKEEESSHFITSVYSNTLGKWILMDPDFGVYMTDEKGNILGVSEIRSRLIAGEPLKTVHTGRSRLTTAWTNFNNFIEGADYTWFLSAHIFKIRCPKVSMFNQRSIPVRDYFELIPDGYRENLLLEGPILTNRGKKIYFMNDENLLWQKPTGVSEPAEK
jgi:hypothetical protein